MKDSEVHLKNFWLIKACSISIVIYCLVGLVDKVRASYTGGPWSNSREEPFFSFAKKTSEYSEIYREQLTSEYFHLYNYRSSTLPGISRNIGRLLRQCRLASREILIEENIKKRTGSSLCVLCGCSIHSVLCTREMYIL
jgi:hypothetical protein